MVAGTRIQFEYTPFWASELERRRPVRIELETFAPDDLIAREIRETGTFFEIELLEHLAIHGPRGGVFVDVGANIATTRCSSESSSPSGWSAWSPIRIS